MSTQWSSEEPCRTESVGAVLMAGEGGAAGGATAGSSSAVGRVDTTAAGPSASPPPAIDMFCPIAENWCYTQASRRAPTQPPTPGGIDGAPVNRVTARPENPWSYFVDGCILRTLGRSGLVMSAVSEDPDSNLTVGSCVYHDSHCDIQPWTGAAHPYCSA